MLTAYGNSTVEKPKKHLINYDLNQVGGMRVVSKPREEKAVSPAKPSEEDVSLTLR